MSTNRREPEGTALKEMRLLVGMWLLMILGAVWTRYHWQFFCTSFIFLAWFLLVVSAWNNGTYDRRDGKRGSGR